MYLPLTNIRCSLLEKKRRRHLWRSGRKTIAIAKEKPGRDHCLEVYGTIQESITRGNVLRYTVDVNGVKLQADTLFRSFSIFQTGERVWLSVEHKNCLQMED